MHWIGGNSNGLGSTTSWSEPCFHEHFRNRGWLYTSADDAYVLPSSPLLICSTEHCFRRCSDCHCRGSLFVPEETSKCYNVWASHLYDDSNSFPWLESWSGFGASCSYTWGQGRGRICIKREDASKCAGRGWEAREKTLHTQYVPSGGTRMISINAGLF